ncbi:dual specificity protein phosphatase 3-like isoform X9 [Branchiostoma floridae x Branchiostoma japonicum]
MLKVLWALESLFAVLGLLLFARLVIIATQLLNRPTSVLPRVPTLYNHQMSESVLPPGVPARRPVSYCKTCSVLQLVYLLREASPDKSTSALLWPRLEKYTEVFPNILLGDRSIAQDVSKLKSLGVTHVLNAAHGAIDVSKEYEKVGIEYLGVPADDVPTYNLKQHFEPAAAFINTAVKKGKVLVHCQIGYSRSPTLVAAYLMLYHELTAQEAIKLIRGKRFIGPNDGFLRQLCEFNDQLVEEGRLELP